MAESFLDGKVTLHRGDCLEVLPLLEADSIDSCMTDPPYHLTSIVKRFGKPNSAPVKIRLMEGQQGSPYARGAKGFMGKQWDGGDIAFRPEIWAEVLRVLKPGAHLLAFSGTRTYHRMACAIEDAGFEIRDQIGWCYGSGFPKSHNIGNGWGSALKPAWEPICLARKPLSESSIAANVLKHGTGGVNVDGCRVGTDESLNGGAYSAEARQRGDGWVTTRKGDENCLRNGAAGEYRQPQGRWPANLIHDGSEEVLAGFPETTSGTFNGNRSADKFRNAYGTFKGTPEGEGFFEGSTGSAARFFYTAKADADDRLGSKHPTVKPIDLMQYLVRLVTPKGGVVLDPFAGTGSMAEAAFYEGMRAVLIEREAEYQADIVKRMGLCLSGPDQRRASSIKQSGHDDLPLFADGRA